MTATPPRPLRIVWADDSQLLRTALVGLMRDRGIEVVGQAHDLDSAIDAVRASRPDVAVLDMCMPPSFSDEGLQAARAARDLQPGIGIVIVSQSVNAATAAQVIKEVPGGIGYHIKDNLTEDAFVDVLERVAAGGESLDPSVLAAVNDLATRRLDRLTRAEVRVLDALAAGLSNLGIANLLFVSERTVEAHVHSIFNRLELPRVPEVHRRVLAAMTYLRANGTG